MLAERGESPLARSTGRRLGRLATVAATLILAVVLLGCGSDDDDSDSNGNGGTDGFGPQVVTQEDIDGREEGSPAAALLEWWQAFQFQDAATVVSLTSDQTLDELGENALEELVSTRGQGLQGVEVLGESESGDTASVRAGLLTFQPEEEGGEIPDEPTASRPITFTMLNEGDQWLFDTPTYLEPMIESMKAAEEEEQSGDEQSGDENQPAEEGSSG
jgi:hypothetical protein